MSKRITFIIFTIFCFSALLLGFSYSKESGVLSRNASDEAEEVLFKVSYVDGNYLDLNNLSTVFNVVNLSSEEKIYSIKIREVNRKSFSDVFVSIDGNKEIALNSDFSYDIKMQPYGTTGDFQSHNVILKFDGDYRFKVSIDEKTEDFSNLLVTHIKNDKQVFEDSKGNYRYFGAKVNNYINIKGVTYQIIGIVDGKVKLISAVQGLGVYNPSIRIYPTLEDYISSFNNSAVNNDNVLNYKSWMTGENGYWLNDTSGSQKAYYASKINGVGTSVKMVDYYLRYAYFVSPELIVAGGNGTKANPYEVTYGN